MKVYIATKFENQAQFNECAELLKLAGHTVAHDWTKESAAGRIGHELTHYLQKCAIADLSAAKHSDAFILIPTAAKQAGAFVEFGAALGSWNFGPVFRNIIIVDAFNPEFQSNIFYHLPDLIHVKTIKEAVQALSK